MNKLVVSKKDRISSLSFCETDVNLTRTKIKPPESVKVKTPSISNKSSYNKSSKNSVNNDLISFDDGLYLNEFHDKLQKSSYQYLPTWNSQRKSSGFNAPISPLDRHKYFPGYNSGIQGAVNVSPSDQAKYMAGVSQQGVQSRKKAPVTPHLAQQTPLTRNIHATPTVTFNSNPFYAQRGYVTSGNNVVMGKPQLYYRKALPKDTKWTGNSENSFEEFIGDVNAHISQQMHLTYII